MAASSNRIMQKTLWITIGLCMAPGVAIAQSVWLPGADPVNIARSGAGVAFGRSIEACSLNPALLATLQPSRAFYLSGGMEMQSAQLTLPSNERVLYTTDRNRAVPSFGFGWRVTPKTALGLKLDKPFLRHAKVPSESGSRFFGQAIDLNSLRAELQLAYAVSEKFSLGVSAGITRLDYAFETALRVAVPEAGNLPWSESNPAVALLETTARQEGSVSGISYGVGFRYAVNSRWTLGGSYHSGVGARPKLVASLPPQGLDIYNTMGKSSPPPPIGVEEQAQAVLNATTPLPGDGRLALPYKIQLGARHRYNQLMTWEIDLLYIGASSMEMPAPPRVNTPSGIVSTIERNFGFKDCLAISGMMELNLGRDWIARTGFSLDSALRKNNEVDAMMGGAQTAGFSIGFGYRIFGGELNVGYQFRQAMDSETDGLEGKWSLDGPGSTGTSTRVEGMGHLWAVGFRVNF